MPTDKREALLRKLEVFEAELNKRRISLMEVANIAFAIFAVPGAAWASVDVVQKLTTNIIQTVAEEKAQEDEAKCLLTTSKGVLGAPRKIVPARIEAYDDEVPF